MPFTPEQIKARLQTSPLWVAKAIVALYRLQTPDEQRKDVTTVLNYVGFNAADAGFGGKLARWILDGKPLTERQLLVGRKISLHYVTQLTQIANANSNANTATVTATQQPVTPVTVNQLVQNLQLTTKEN